MDDDLDDLETERRRVFIGTWGSTSGPLNRITFGDRTYWGESGHCPEWIAGELPDHIPADWCVTFQCSNMDNVLRERGDDWSTLPPGWSKLRAWEAGEHSCPWCNAGTGEESKRPTCKLCEGSGYLYDSDAIVVLYPNVPSETAVSAELAARVNALAAPGAGELECRLAVDADGTWHVWTGPVDFDTHHSPFCASLTVEIPDPEVCDLYGDRDLYTEASDAIHEIVSQIQQA